MKVTSRLAGSKAPLNTSMNSTDSGEDIRRKLRISDDETPAPTGTWKRQATDEIDRSKVSSGTAANDKPGLFGKLFGR
jgi:hypothetical protein